ncbi:MAG TPA: hypothetical protein VMY78_16990 [Solirubrobacteraceae bacterium]|nr:hypothetical protein [Solirubrobacteraceae bacterium]
MPDEVSEKAASTGSPSTSSRLIDLLLQALPAIGGAVGFVGFVAVIGGAIEWVRFWSAKLPADQAVEVIPRTQLVTIGAASMIGFTLLGLLAVLIAYLVDRRGTASMPTWRGVIALSVAALLATLVHADLSGWALAAIAGWIIGIGGLSVGTIDRRTLKWVRRRARPRRLRDALAQLEAAHRNYVRAADAVAGPQPPGGYEALVAQERDTASKLWVELCEVERLTQEVSDDSRAPPKTDDEPANETPAGTSANEIRPAALIARSTNAEQDARVALGEDSRVFVDVRLLRKLKAQREGAEGPKPQPYGALAIVILVAVVTAIGAFKDRYWLIPAVLLLPFPVYFRRVDLFTLTLLIGGTAVLVAFEETAWLASMVLPCGCPRRDDPRHRTRHQSVRLVRDSRLPRCAALRGHPLRSQDCALAEAAAGRGRSQERRRRDLRRLHRSDQRPDLPRPHRGHAKQR